MENGIGEMINLTSGYHNQFKIQGILSSASINFLSLPVLLSSAADHVSEKLTIDVTTNSFATGCSNFLSPLKNPRKLYSIPTSSNMRTYDHPEKNQLQKQVENLLDTGSQGTATAGSDVVQSGRPIFDDFFQHLRPYIGNNMANVVFQMVKRLWFIRIDQSLYIAPQKTV
ncbi:hypothetical protein TNCV_4687741 [Trichonephila clavipes]|nr:hypothetical protein TNCV_4687741 [Trichonephila clavipes]